MQLLDGQTLKIKFGKLIAEKRKAYNWSQEYLAEKLDIHVRTLGKLENGHAFVNADTLCKLSEVFNIPIKTFFDIEDNTMNVNEHKLNIIIDKLRSGGNEKIDYYFDVINVIDRKYNG